MAAASTSAAASSSSFVPIPSHDKLIVSGTRLSFRGPAPTITPVAPYDAQLCRVMGDTTTMKHLLFMSRHDCGGWKAQDAIDRRTANAKANAEQRACFLYMYVPNALAASAGALPAANADVAAAIAESKACGVSDHLIGITGFPFIGTTKFYKQFFAAPAAPATTAATATATAATATAAAAATDSKADTPAPAAPAGSTLSAAADSDTYRMGEFGIILHHPYHRVAFSVEAHAVGLGYGFDVLKLDAVVFGTHVTNTAMRGFFKQFGIAEGGIGRPNSQPGFINYEITRAQWPAVKDALQSHLADKLRTLGQASK